MATHATLATAYQPSILDIARAGAPSDLPSAALRSIVQQTGSSMGTIVRSFGRLTFGPGKVSFADYVKLRLFDREFHDGSPLDTYVGQRRNRDLCVTANFRHDWLGLLTNKVASLSFLAAYGFPTVPIKLIYAPEVRTASSAVVSDREALARFLSQPDNYPLFGKPVEGYQSLGSIALVGCDPSSRQLQRTDGSAVSLDRFIDELSRNYPAGYLFQPLMSSHREIAALCGPRIATVRLVTITCEDGPRLFRAAWKIPAGRNVADNFWRPGNLLARIDLATGRAGPVVSGTGLATREHSHHPDTGMALPGFRHPSWEGMRTLALEGARLMRHVPLIGWDIACTPDGPVVVEMNETPDFFLVQFADRRGVLDAAFAAFMACQKVRASSHARRFKADIRKL